jgi:hypothetical protein
MMIVMDKYRVTLTAEERADLEQLVSRGKAADRKLIHARILLLADDSCGEERPDDQIAGALASRGAAISAGCLFPRTSQRSAQRDRLCPGLT